MSRQRKHPALRLAMRIGHWDSILGVSGAEKDARFIARHVKPLVAALHANHQPIAESRNHPADCPDCRLIAEWEAPL